MKYCKRCLYPENHPLNLTFDDAGVCSGCRVHEEKDALDWEERFARLERIAGDHRRKAGRGPDCIVPVSGARDSYFIVHIVKNVLKLNPLLVSYNKQYNTKLGIRNLAYLRTLFDCDYVMKALDPRFVKRINRVTLRRMGSMYWHCLAGTTVFPVQMAANLKIPLIIWGAHQGLDQVGMFSHLDEVEMTRKYRKEHDLMGWEAEDLAALGEGLSAGDLEPFAYPDDKELEVVGVRGIYLGNYIRWDSKKQHEKMIQMYGYESREQIRTFDTYNDVDCFHYSGLHDYIKFLKYGFGKVTDHATREIRLKRLTREEGIGLVERYAGAEPSDMAFFLDWMGMPKEELLECVDAHRDPTAWEKGGAGEWHLRDSVTKHLNDEGVEEARLRKKEDCRFVLTPSRRPGEAEDRYVILAKGYVN
ncbi:MAG: N-acetyl sugar amidotransferase [Candidatus Tectomicrobia bacterium]|uniref:N-acetyl sugar amidotransferase n=1 Tax=Tectimicrobiota bacterium TaxID=2528274 RepID=A0A932HV29_UNCTE|nr:N-acetyl sugar amidotransferase [Candidatus Tectomicrobia bacterium]